MTRKDSLLLPEVEVPGSTVNAWGRTKILDDLTSLRLIINYPDPYPRDELKLMIDDKVVWTHTLANGNEVPLTVDLDPPHLKCCRQSVSYEVYTHIGNLEESAPLNLLKKH